MKTLVLNSENIERLLDLNELRNAMVEALKLVSSERPHSDHRYESKNKMSIDSFSFPIISPRHVVELRNGNALGYMPAQTREPLILGYKAVAVFASNAGFNLNPHQGVMTLLCPETGRVKSFLEGSRLTAFRTAATSAAATDTLSKKNSRTLTILGGGEQAFQHIKALLKVRKFDRVNIYARNRLKLDKIYNEFSTKLELQYKSSAEEAVKDSDVIVTCTSSPEPIIDSSRFSVGVHVNAIGSCRPFQQEVKFRLNPKIKIFLDHGPSCLLEADEIYHPNSRENISSMVAGEIGEVLNKRKMGRESQDDITVFKSVGVAVEDLFAAEYFYKKAIREKVGTFIQL